MGLMEETTTPEPKGWDQYISLYFDLLDMTTVPQNVVLTRSEKIIYKSSTDPKTY